MAFQKLTFIFAIYFTSMYVIVASAQIDLAPPADTDIGIQHKPCREPSPQYGLRYLGNLGTKQFFVFNNNTLVSWQDAVTICKESGMVLVKIGSAAEMDFVNKVVITDKIGPVWFGARDLGGKSAFRWTTTINPIGPQYASTSTYTIGDYVNFSDLLQNGPLALQMNTAVSTMVFPAPSFLKSALAFCQSPPNH